MNEINDLANIDEFIKKSLKKNINTSYSGLFKRYRMKAPLIGDYPIFSRIAQVMGECGIRLKPNQVYTALKYSIEWKGTHEGKEFWVKDFVEINEENLKNEKVRVTNRGKKMPT